MSATDALPQFHHRERHSISVRAPAEEALAAAWETRLTDLRAVRALLRLRGMARAPGGTVVDAMTADGFSRYDDETLVAVGKPWSPRGGMRRIEDFAGFSEPGYAKMAMDLRHADGRLHTETRVLLTSPGARRVFGAYWLVIRPFSGAIRRSWLRAAKRRAEA